MLQRGLPETPGATFCKSKACTRPFKLQRGLPETPGATSPSPIIPPVHSSRFNGASRKRRGQLDIRTGYEQKFYWLQRGLPETPGATIGGVEYGETPHHASTGPPGNAGGNSAGGGTPHAAKGGFNGASRKRRGQLISLVRARLPGLLQRGLPETPGATARDGHHPWCKQCMLQRGLPETPGATSMDSAITLTRSLLQRGLPETPGATGVVRVVWEVSIMLQRGLPETPGATESAGNLRAYAGELQRGLPETPGATSRFKRACTRLPRFNGASRKRRGQRVPRCTRRILYSSFNGASRKRRGQPNRPAGPARRARPLQRGLPETPGATYEPKEPE